MYGDILKCKHWLRGHRLAIAAWNVQHPGQDSNLTPVRAFLDKELSGQDQKQFNNLPLLTLTLLGQLDHVDLEQLGKDFEFVQFRERVERARSILIKEAPNGAKPSLARSAQLVAEVILRPTSLPHGIALFARELLDRSWNLCVEDGRLRKAIEAFSSLQIAETGTGEKIGALARVVSAVADKQGEARLTGWAHVEYALLNKLLAWPLCAASPTWNAPGISYPLAVDVLYGKAKPVQIDNERRIKLGEGSGEDFSRSMQLAIEAAIDLWKSQNGSASKTLKQHVARAQILLNTAPAAALTEPFGPGFGAHISGRSLEAYFALIALGRLSRIDFIPPVGVSGTIEERVDQRNRAMQSTISPDDAYEPVAISRSQPFWRPNPRQTNVSLGEELSLDRAIGKIGQIAKKYEWALASRQFTTVILPVESLDASPDGNELRRMIGDARKEHETFVQTLFPRSLSRAADIAYGTRWRRYRSVRADDVLHAMLGARVVDRKDKGVMTALGVLQHNNATVARVDVGLKALVSALSYLSRDWAPNLDPRPPLRSILFFRMVHSEPRARLLTSLFSAIGAYPEDLQEILNASSPEEAAGVMARVLNQRESSTGIPFRRAPDIVVFILPSGERWKTRSPVNFDEHLEFVELFSERTLGGLLKPTTDERWRSKINKTRILIVNDGELDGLVPTGKPPERNEQEIYRRLGIFRSGFTQAMATRMLEPGSLKGKSVRDWLEGERNAGRLHEAGGRYFLTPACRRSLLSNQYMPVEFADLHMKASLSLAPYLARSADERHAAPPGVVHQEAADPSNIHEAQFHLAAIDELEAHAKKMLGPVRWKKGFAYEDSSRHRYQTQLSCFFEPPNWDLARFAIANPRFVQEYLVYAVTATRTLLEAVDIETLPAIRITAALGLFDRYLERLRGAQAEAFRSEIRARTTALAAACSKRIDGLRSKASKPGARADDVYQWLFAASHLTALAMRAGGLELGLPSDRISALCGLIRDKVIENDRKNRDLQDTQIGFCVAPEWFIRYGLAVMADNPNLALALFRIGRQHRRGRIKRSIGLFVNALGLAAPGSEEASRVLSDLSAVRDENPNKLEKLRRGAHDIENESATWRAGVSRLEAWFNQSGVVIAKESVSDSDEDDEHDSDSRAGADLSSVREIDHSD